MPGVLRRQPRPDDVGDPFEVLGGQATTGPGGGTDADYGHIGLAHGADGVVAHGQPPARYSFGGDVGDPSFDHRRLTARKTSELPGIDVQTDDRVTPAREACCGDTSDVPETEDAELRARRVYPMIQLD